MNQLDHGSKRKRSDEEGEDGAAAKKYKTEMDAVGSCSSSGGGGSTSSGEARIGSKIEELIQDSLAAATRIGQVIKTTEALFGFVGFHNKLLVDLWATELAARPDPARRLVLVYIAYELIKREQEASRGARPRLAGAFAQPLAAALYGLATERDPKLHQKLLKLIELWSGAQTFEAAWLASVRRCFGPDGRSALVAMQDIAEEKEENINEQPKQLQNGAEREPARDLSRLVDRLSLAAPTESVGAELRELGWELALVVRDCLVSHDPSGAASHGSYLQTLRAQLGETLRDLACDATLSAELQRRLAAYTLEIEQHQRHLEAARAAAAAVSSPSAPVPAPVTVPESNMEPDYSELLLALVGSTTAQMSDALAQRSSPGSPPLSAIASFSEVLSLAQAAYTTVAAPLLAASASSSPSQPPKEPAVKSEPLDELPRLESPPLLFAPVVPVPTAFSLASAPNFAWKPVPTWSPGTQLVHDV